MPTVKRKARPPTDWVKPTDEPQFAWGPAVFGPREPDYADGAVVGGLVIRRAPDGTVVGIVESPKDGGDA